jgi:hypothetical protein
MNSSATVRPRGRSRLALIVAGVLALLGSFAVTAPAQAGYYEGSYPCSYRCGYSPYRYYHQCSACGCGRRCYSTSRPSLVYERRYREREYVERRYGWPARHYRRHYGYYRGGYRSWSRPFPWGYGGVRREPYGYRYEPSADRYAEPPRRLEPAWDDGYGEARGWREPYRYRYEPPVDRYREPPAPGWDDGYSGGRGWRAPYGYRYEPSADRYRYEEPPRPPAPVWDGGGYDAVPYRDESARWSADRSRLHDASWQEPIASYGIADVSRPVPGGPVGMIASGLLGLLNIGMR